MDKFMIEILQDKNYVRAFGLMKPEERICLEKAGKLNCLRYSDINGESWRTPSPGPFTLIDTYAIKPDYKPEPEFVDLEIVAQIGFLGVVQTDKSKLPYTFTHLNCLPSLPGFCRFKTADCPQTAYEEVAGLIANGKTVHAVFRA